MVYIYKKIIGNRTYYYLRASVRRGSKLLTKDIAYLGRDVKELRKKLADLPSKYSKEIRKAYKTINRFIEVNHHLQEVRSSKIKIKSFINKDLLENVEACKLHWNGAFQKLDNTTKNEVLKNFIIEFAFNTTSIEGNTITLKEAKNLLEEGLSPKNKTLREVYDLQNTEKVFFNLIDKKAEITHELIMGIHSGLRENIDLRKGYRTQDVRVIKANFKSTPAPYVKADMDILLKWYKEHNKKLHPLVLATVFHHKFEKIHPFMDGNGRTGRMLLNYILLKNDYPHLIIHKKFRQEYLESLRFADNVELTKFSDKHYSKLIDFSADEMTQYYWNIFL